jgi:hypothetical protein
VTEVLKGMVGAGDLPDLLMARCEDDCLTDGRFNGHASMAYADRSAPNAKPRDQTILHETPALRSSFHQ